MKFMVTVECFGRIVVREFEAPTLLGAKLLAEEAAGLKVHVRPQVDVEEQVRLAKLEAAT